jgi:HD-like signal output (HDOD) protein
MNPWLQRLLHREPRASAPSRTAPADHSAVPSSTSSGWSPWRASIDLDVAFCRWLLGQGSSGGAASLEHEAAWLAAVESTVLTGDAATALVPRVPAVVPQLLRTLRDPAGSTSALARQVGHDPVLVAAVLKVANSPYFKPAQPIASIEQALLVLGHDGLRQLLASVAFKPILNLQSGAATRRGAPLVWSQSERCGVACHMLAPVMGVSAFETFLAALLENVGAIVVLRILDRSGYAQGDAYSSDFCQPLMRHARRFACDIGRQWTFPASSIQAIAEQDPGTELPGRSPLGELLQTCCRLSKARILFDAGQVALEDLALEDNQPVSACFARLGEGHAG